MARIVAIALLLGAALNAAPARAQAVRLDPAAAYVGDIVRLSIEYRSEIPSLFALETRPLERDFEVLKIDSRTSRAIADDGYINRMHWEIELVPRRAGTLRLPRLAVGDWRTPALTLPVLPLPGAARAAQQVTVEVEADAAAPYVGQQINLKLRVRHNTPVSQPYWSEPRIADALSFRGVDENDYRDGGFDVNERTMAVFAGAPGRLRIPSASFRARIGGWRGADGNAIPPRRIFRRSRPLELELREVPDEFGDGPWLPARALEWSQRWELPDGDYRIGDSLRRILTIEARGLPSSALPDDLFAVEGDAYRVYPDRATRRHGFDGGDLVAHLEQPFAIVLTRAGSVEIPALRLAWWDVGADRLRELTLPGRSLVVAALPGPDMAGETALGRLAGPRSWLLMLALLLSGWVVFVVVRRGQADAALRLWRLRAACRGQDPAAARRALLDWASRRQRPALVGLWQLRRQLRSPALIGELERLDAALYAPIAATWRGDRLWRALRAELWPHWRWRRPAAIRLAPLYPRGQPD